jgi:hypothetical protein
MGEIRKLAAILVSDVVGYSRLAGTDEERTLARLRTLRSDLIDPTIALHHGRVVSRLSSLQPDPLINMDGVGAAGGPIGVYRPEDRLTPPALRRGASDITSQRTGSSSLPCPRRPHELRASTIPSRRSFFGFAGPVDGAHGELTRQRHHLFRRSIKKGRPESRPPCHLHERGDGLAHGLV